MKKVYTFFFLYNNLEDPAFEFISNDYLNSVEGQEFHEIYNYLDNQAVQVSNQVVEKLINYGKEILENR